MANNNNAKESSSTLRHIKALLRKREQNLTLLQSDTVSGILRKGLDLTPGIKIPESSKGPGAKLIWLLYHHLRVSDEEKAKTSTRRDALKIARSIFAQIDAAHVREKTAEKRRASGNTNTKEKKKAHDGTANDRLPGKENGTVLAKKVINQQNRHQKSSSVVQQQPPRVTQKANSTAGAINSIQATTASPTASSSTNHGKKLSNQQAPAQKRVVSEATIASNKSSTAATAAPGSKKRTYAQSTGQQQQQQPQTVQTVQRSASTGSTANKPPFMLANFCDKNNAYSNSTGIQEGNNNNTTNQNRNAVGLPARAPPPYQARSQNVTTQKNGIPVPGQKNGDKTSLPASGSKAYQLNKNTGNGTINKAQQEPVQQQPPPAKNGQTRAPEKSEAQKKADATAAEAKRKLAESEAKAKRKAERAKAVVSAVYAAVTTGREKMVTFPADTATVKKSACLFGRKETTVSYKPRALTMEHATNLATRFSRWDPYWKVCRYVSCGVTSTGKTVTLVPDKSKAPPKAKTMPSGIAWCPVKLASSDTQDMKNTDWGNHRNSNEFMDGQKRLILRMIPVVPNVKKRADTHLWPKGSFVVVNGTPMSLDQRKHQSHDETYWSGLSKHLDLTPHINFPQRDNVVKILNYDDQPFYFCIALCTYVSPATLYKHLTTTTPPNDMALEKLTRAESTAHALTFTKQNTLILDDDDDDDDEAPQAPGDDTGRIVFTLTCPFSKSTMEKPVRGKNCKHFQVGVATAFNFCFYFWC